MAGGVGVLFGAGLDAAHWESECVSVALVHGCNNGFPVRVCTMSGLDEWLYRLVNGDRRTWDQVKGFAGAVAVGLLFWAAIYELVKW